jgi:hypothetical protein
MTDPMPMQVRRSESGEVSMCGIDELFAASTGTATHEVSRRRDDRCWYGNDPLDWKSFSHRNSARPSSRPCRTLQDEWQTALGWKCAKLRHWQVSKAREDSCKVPGLFQRLRLARRKCWGFNRVLLHSTAFISCVPASSAAAPHLLLHSPPHIPSTSSFT